MHSLTHFLNVVPVLFRLIFIFFSESFLRLVFLARSLAEKHLEGFKDLGNLNGQRVLQGTSRTTEAELRASGFGQFYYISCSELLQLSNEPNQAFFKVPPP